VRLDGSWLFFEGLVFGNEGEVGEKGKGEDRLAENREKRFHPYVRRKGRQMTKGRRSQNGQKHRKPSEREKRLVNFKKKGGTDFEQRYDVSEKGSFV